MKICKGKIGKHNYAFVKSLLDTDKQSQLMNLVINDVPFNGMTKEESETFISTLDKEHFSRYVKLLLNTRSEK